MSPRFKRSGLVAIGISIMVAIGLATVHGYRQEAAALATSISGTNCISPCWRGIQPAITDRETVEQWLNDNAIAFQTGQTGVENDSLRWDLTATDELAVPDAELPVVTLAFDSRNNKVWRIGIFDIHICLQTVVKTYGIPPLINNNQSNVLLGYPDAGILFNVNKERYTITSLGIMSADWIKYSVEMSAGNDWQNISTKIPLECVDSFSQ